MKDEMELVQDMETAEDRDADAYIENLETILKNKSSAILHLQMELKQFQEIRRKAGTIKQHGSRK